MSSHACTGPGTPQGQGLAQERAAHVTRRQRLGPRCPSRWRSQQRHRHVGGLRRACAWGWSWLCCRRALARQRARATGSSAGTYTAWSRTGPCFAVSSAVSDCRAGQRGEPASWTEDGHGGCAHHGAPTSDAWSYTGCDRGGHHRTPITSPSHDTDAPSRPQHPHPTTSGSVVGRVRGSRLFATAWIREAEGRAHLSLSQDPVEGGGMST